MLNIDFLENSGYFKKKLLKAGNMLFDEGDIDNNLYLIKSGQVSIEKYISEEKNKTKKLAILKKGDFFGEGSLNNNFPKEVKIITDIETELLFINAKNGLQKLINKYPSEGFLLLKHLIKITNDRLLKSNSLITATYEINRKIISLDEISIKNIFEIINNIKNIVSCDYILYLEKYEAINKSLLLKYNTSKGMKILDIIIEIKNNCLNIDDLTNYISKYTFIQKLSIGNRNLGYLIFCKKNKNFTENDKKIIVSITPSLSGVIRHKEVFNEKRDIDYMTTK